MIITRAIVQFPVAASIQLRSKLISDTVTLPHGLLPYWARRYIKHALEHILVTYLEEDEEFYAEIPGLDGLYGTGDTEEATRVDLQAALETWVRVRLSRQLPLPPAQLG